MKKWEYEVHLFGMGHKKEKLNEFGQDGLACETLP